MACENIAAFARAFNIMAILYSKYDILHVYFHTGLTFLFECIIFILIV